MPHVYRFADEYVHKCGFVIKPGFEYPIIRDHGKQTINCQHCQGIIWLDDVRAAKASLRIVTTSENQGKVIVTSYKDRDILARIELSPFEAMTLAQTLLNVALLESRNG